LRKPYLILGIVLLPALAALGQPRGLISLDPPGPREFVLDLGEIITPQDEETIRAIADQLLSETATPIVVVTISDMANYAQGDLRIETFATVLFNQWEIGHDQIDGQDWNTGILLLVAVGNRQARIELGAGWGREHDAQAQQIMEEFIIPQFKAGNFSAGIVAGVEALDKMARGLTLPKPPPKPIEPKHMLIGLGIIGLLIFTVVSLIRSGMSGWAWVFWGAIFAILGLILYNMARNAGRSGGSFGGGGFSGGSFGGGFSGGGGATGSW
jgi:uncharacterized protein